MCKVQVCVCVCVRERECVCVCVCAPGRARESVLRDYQLKNIIVLIF